MMDDHYHRSHSSRDFSASDSSSSSSGQGTRDGPPDGGSGDAELGLFSSNRAAAAAAAAALPIIRPSSLSVTDTNKAATTSKTGTSTGSNSTNRTETAPTTAKDDEDAASLDRMPFRPMNIKTSKPPKAKGKKSHSGWCTSSSTNQAEHSSSSSWSFFSHWPILLVSFFIFAVLAAASISVVWFVQNGKSDERRDAVLNLATETGAFFAKELDLAILPLFSMAQFATELEIFADLPNQIGSPDRPDKPYLPMLPNPPNATVIKAMRNVTGVCDEPELVKRFTKIAAAVKANANMDGILHNIQLAPEGTFFTVFLFVFLSFFGCLCVCFVMYGFKCSTTGHLKMGPF